MRAIGFALLMSLVLAGCATSNVPNPTYPPNVTSGNGWRLLFTGDGPAPTTRHYSGTGGVAAATDAADYSRLWTSIAAAPGDPPAVDFATEFVAMFDEISLVECPLNLVAVDIVQDTVNIAVDTPIPPGQACSLLAKHTVFVLALRRDRFTSMQVRIGAKGEGNSLSVDLGQPGVLYTVPRPSELTPAPPGGLVGAGRPAWRRG